MQVVPEKEELIPKRKRSAGRKRARTARKMEVTERLSVRIE